MLKPIGTDQQIATPTFHSGVQLHSSCSTGKCSTLSTCCEDGCLSYVAYPFKNVWEGIVWLFTTIFCCSSCNKSEETTENTIDPVAETKAQLETQITKLSDMKTLLEKTQANKAFTKLVNDNLEKQEYSQPIVIQNFKKSWRKKFDALPRDAQRLLLVEDIRAINEGQNITAVFINKHIAGSKSVVRGLETQSDGDGRYSPILLKDMPRYFSTVITNLKDELKNLEK